MDRLGKSSIQVTDIANQFWCERQMEYNYLYGRKYTKQMAQGKQLHEALQEEVYVPLTIEPITYEDFMYKTSYENFRSLRSLKETGMCRELRVYGSLNGYRISGQIDEMRVAEGRARIVERKTTDANRQLTEVYTRPHRVQVMMYRKLLGDIKAHRYTGENFAKVYGLPGKGLSEQFRRELLAAGISSDLADPLNMSKRMFDEIYTMPDLSNRLEIAYVDRFSGKQISSMEIEYNEKEMERDTVYSMGFWNGERESAPVPEEEKWKCTFCKFFGNECKVWWGQRELFKGAE